MSSFFKKIRFFISIVTFVMSCPNVFAEPTGPSLKEASQAPLPVVQKQSSYFPATLWQVSELSENVISADFGDVDGSSGGEILLLTQNKLMVYRAVGQSAQKLREVKAKAKEKFIRVSFWPKHRLVLVNGYDGTQVISTVALWDGKNFKRVQTLPGLLSVAQARESDKKVYYQESYDFWKPSAYVVPMSWNGKKFVKAKGGKSVKLKKSDGRVPHLWNVGLREDGEWLALSQNGQVSVYDRDGKRDYKSGLRYGGAVLEVETSTKDPLGVAMSQSLGIMPRVEAMPESPEWFVVKNFSTIPGDIVSLPTVRHSQFFRLNWMNSALQETFSSSKFDGIMSDVKVIDYFQDGIADEVMLVLNHRKSKVAGARGEKSSVVVLETRRRSLLPVEENPPIIDSH
jgi:hypothetical protein